MKSLKRKPSLSDEVYSILINEISKMTPGNNCLPSEEYLSRSLNVSRATIRDALKRLTLNHLTTTVHGKGTFAHPSTLQIENRLDIESDFIEMLKRQFNDVSVKQDWLSKAAKTDFTKKAFDDKLDNVYATKWIYMANGKCMLFGRYYLFKEYFTNKPDFTVHYESLPALSEKYMRAEIDYCIMKSYIKYDSEAAKLFEIPELTPINCWDEDILDTDDHRVGVGEIFVHPKNITLSIVTKLEKSIE